MTWQTVLALAGLVSSLLGVAGGFAFKITQRVTTVENDIRWIKEYVLKDSLLAFHQKQNPTPDRINELIDKLIRGMDLTKPEIAELKEWLAQIQNRLEGKERWKAEAALHLLEEQYL